MVRAESMLVDPTDHSRVSKAHRVFGDLRMSVCLHESSWWGLVGYEAGLACGRPYVLVEGHSGP